LEYDPFNPHVWLTGVLIADRGRREHLALWADTPAAERRALRALINVCATHPALPILTWAGISADLPKLRDAAHRHDLTSPIAAIAARHVDLYQHAARTIRLPIPDMALGAVADYLSIPRTSAISGGLEAQMRYAEYRGCPDPERRAALRAELTAYNRDDLDALADVLRALQTLGIREPLGATAGRDRAVDRFAA
jgi:predicted RecB family nuclease